MYLKALKQNWEKNKKKEDKKWKNEFAKNIS